MKVYIGWVEWMDIFYRRMEVGGAGYILSRCGVIGHCYRCVEGLQGWVEVYFEWMRWIDILHR